MGVVALRVYNRERYKEYIASIIKKASSTVVLMEYLKISWYLKAEAEECQLKHTQLKN